MTAGDSTPVRRHEDQPARSTISKYAVVLGALTAITPLTIDMYLPALPEIAEAYRASDSAAQLTITGTLLGVAIGQLIAGPLSDRFGRRRPLITGMLVHLVASLLCAIAPTIGLLIAFRTMQGLGASAGTVIALAVVRDMFTGLPAARLMARLSIVFGVAPILAPTLGSLVLQTTEWPGIFVLLAIFAAALSAVAAFLLPETLPPVRRRPGGLGTAFATYASLLRERRFVGITVVSGLAFAVILGYVSAASFVMQNEHGLSTGMFGLAFGVNSLGLIIMGQLNPLLLRRFRGETILGGTLTVIAAAAAALTVLQLTGTGGLAWMLVLLFVIMSGNGLIFPNVPTLALADHGDEAGTAAAVLGAGQFGIGASLSSLVGVAGAVTGLSMALVLLGAAVLALLTLHLVVRPAARPAS